MSSTPFICCSIGVATDCSTVSASAPGYELWIWMRGGTMSGNFSTGSPNIESSPPRTVTIEMTIATIGRLMKKRTTELPSSGRGQRGGRLGRRRGSDGRDDHPRLDAREALDNHLLAGLEPILDDPHAADALGGLDLPDLPSVPRA